jgi:NTE family protein
VWLDPLFLRPDVLVLAGGGILGEAWMSGLLAGIENGGGVDMTAVESLVGTSAGSIVAARLVAGRHLRRPIGIEGGALGDREPPQGDGDTRAAGRRLGAAARWGTALASPLAPVALALHAPGGALVRSAVLRRLPDHGEALDALHERVASWRPRFDGRLRVVAVDRRSGRRVVFGAPGAPHADVADAVQASCAIPWVFRPVGIGGREYVDGGAWSFTNIDAAPATEGTYVLCLDPSASLASALSSPLGLLRATVRSAAAVEALALRRRGAHVHTIGPSADAAALMAASLMDPGPRDRVLAAGYRQGLELTARR